MKGRTFLGVHPSNDLPHVNSHNAYVIFNYSPSSGAGTHWVAVGNLNSTDKTNAWFFDSYGRKPDSDDSLLSVNTDFTDYLRQNSSTGQYDYNTFDYQSWTPTSDDAADQCGEYSAAAVVYDWGKNKDTGIWARLKSMKNAHDRDRYIRKIIGIKK